MSVLSDRRKRRIFLLYVTTHACAGLVHITLYISFRSVNRTVLDGHVLQALTRTTPTGFLSNLVQRERLGWPTCMPIYFLFDLKNGDMAAIFVF